MLVSMTTGVNGAIHSKAGEKLLEECKEIGLVEVGGARMTSGHNLPSAHVIHTVGPQADTKDRAGILRYGVYVPAA